MPISFLENRRDRQHPFVHETYTAYWYVTNKLHKD
jgi:hypothetical protein